jgi:hypothetical protein
MLARLRAATLWHRPVPTGPLSASEAASTKLGDLRPLGCTHAGHGKNVGQHVHNIALNANSSSLKPDTDDEMSHCRQFGRYLVPPTLSQLLSQSGVSCLAYGQVSCGRPLGECAMPPTPRSPKRGKVQG